MVVWTFWVGWGGREEGVVEGESEGGGRGDDGRWMWRADGGG